MIVSVKRSTLKKKLIKLISLLALIGMFTAYYFHMSEEFAKQNEIKLAESKKVKELRLKKEKSKKIERLIYNEIEIAVELLGQEYVKKVKLIGKRVIIVCEINTNIEPLMVRYGTMALVKTTLRNTKIAIDLKHIVRKKYNDL